MCCEQALTAHFVGLAYSENSNGVCICNKLYFETSLLSTEMDERSRILLLLLLLYIFIPQVVQIPGVKN